MVDVEILLTLREDGRRQIGDRDAEVAVVEMDPDDRAGGRVEAKQRRRTASALDLAERLLDHETLRLQVGDERRDGRAREAGMACDLAAAGGPPLAQRVDHAQPVQLP